jgi:SMC interacting uncharacterized protein involved in chromosome segregation
MPTIKFEIETPLNQYMDSIEATENIIEFLQKSIDDAKNQMLRDAISFEEMKNKASERCELVDNGTEELRLRKKTRNVKMTKKEKSRLLEHLDRKQAIEGESKE